MRLLILVLPYAVAQPRMQARDAMVGGMVVRVDNAAGGSVLQDVALECGAVGTRRDLRLHPVAVPLFHPDHGGLAKPCPCL